ncbi:MAG: Isochorismate synthase [Bacteroidota bacterium]
MNLSLAKIISGESFGYHITLPHSMGDKVLSGNWNANNDVLPFHPKATPGKVGGKCLNQQEYIQLVDKAKLAMEREHWKKIVTSRCFEVPKTIDLNEQYVLALHQRFPEAYLIVFNHPVWGKWLAASPELLIKKKGQVIETMALAGTLSADSLGQWGEKEIKEHEVVRDMIVETLHSNGVDHIQSMPRNELYYKTVRHLQTKITGQYQGEEGALFHALSPTPALAGMPVKPVMDWLVENEGYHRGLYGGIIHVKNGDESFAIVLLRCMHWSNRGAWGFVGGGIMPDSRADSEWNETVMKQNAFIFDPNESIQ